MALGVSKVLYCLLWLSKSHSYHVLCRAYNLQLFSVCACSCQFYTPAVFILKLILANTTTKGTQRDGGKEEREYIGM